MHERGQENMDEDLLDRERDDDDGDERPRDALSEVYEGIRDGDEQMRQVALTLGRCLTRMGRAQGHDELSDFYERCCRLVDAVCSDDDDERDEQ